VRVALLIGRGRTGEGALSLPRDQVVAFRTDGIYVTGDPGWQGSRPGEFRAKSHAGGPVSTPRTWHDLDALRSTRLQEWGVTDGQA
jgi:hypothetical protein